MISVFLVHAYGLLPLSLVCSNNITIIINSSPLLSPITKIIYVLHLLTPPVIWITDILTGPILAVPVPHHAFTLEGPPGSLVAAADPLDANVGMLLQHIMDAWSASTV